MRQLHNSCNPIIHQALSVQQDFAQIMSHAEPMRHCHPIDFQHQCQSNCKCTGNLWTVVVQTQGVQHVTAKATRIAPHCSSAGSAGWQNGHSNGSYDALSSYAKAYAHQGGQQLKVLGEAGMKYLSGAVHTWRNGATAENGCALSALQGGFCSSADSNSMYMTSEQAHNMRSIARCAKACCARSRTAKEAQACICYWFIWFPAQPVSGLQFKTTKTLRWWAQ